MERVLYPLHNNSCLWLFDVHEDFVVGLSRLGAMRSAALSVVEFGALSS